MRTNKGQAAAIKLINSETRVRNILKCPEIYHWLGLLELEYLELDHEEEQKKDFSRFINERLEDEIDDYVEEIHSKDSVKLQEEMNKILTLSPPLLKPKH